MKKRYWLKSGITLGIFCVIIVFVAKLEVYNNFLNIIAVPALIIEIILSIPVGIIEEFLKIRGLFSPGEFIRPLTFYGQIFMVIFWSIIGCVVGWLYGKIKNKKSSITKL